MKKKMEQTVTVISKMFADAQIRQRMAEITGKELAEAEAIVTKPKTLYEMLEEKLTHIDFCNMGWSTVCGDAWIAVNEGRLYVMSRGNDQHVEIADCTPMDDRQEIVSSANIESVFIALRMHVDKMAKRVG